MYNVYVFSTYFAKDPSSLSSIANVITTNTIMWNNVETIDISPSIAEFIKAVA
jgi:phosphoribosylpyrophosphate synthetase